MDKNYFCAFSNKNCRVWSGNSAHFVLSRLWQE